MRTITRKKRLGFCAALTIFVLSLAGSSQAGLIGAAGDLYVGDGDLGGIFQYDGVTGDSVPGNFTGRFALRGARTFAGQAWGPDGNLYAVTNANTSRWDVDKFDGSTGTWLGATVPHLNDGSASVGKAMTFGPDGDLYVADWWRFRIDRYQAGSYTLKASYLHVDGDYLGTPNDMKFAPNGHLMVLSGGWNRVLEFDTASNAVNLLGTFAEFPTAQQPQGLAFGPNGNLFVTGGYTGGVREFDGTTGASIGDFVPQDGTLSTGGVLFDNHGRLLVTTSGTNEHAYAVVAYDAVTGALLGDLVPYGSGGISSPGYMSIKPVPEPVSASLLLIGLGLATRRRQRRAFRAIVNQGE